MIGWRLGCIRIALFAVEGDLDRPPGELCEKSRLGLDGHVFLATESTPVGNELDLQLILVDSQHTGHLPPIVEDSLPLGKELEATPFERFCQGAFGFEIEVLDALGFPGAADHVGAGGQRGLGVPAVHNRVRQGVFVSRIDLWGCALCGCEGIEDGFQHFVVDLDQGGRGSRGVLILGRDRSQHIAHASHLFSFGNEDRPVVIEQANPAMTRDIPRGGHRHNARKSLGLRGVDAQDPSARVLREDHGPMQETRPLHVVHVGTIPESHLLARDPASELPTRPSSTNSGCASPRRAAASNSMASKILMYPVQRQRCPVRALAISSRVGEGFLSSRCLAWSANPGIQKPHCSPAAATKQSAINRRSSSLRPSRVDGLPCPVPARRERRR